MRRPVYAGIAAAPSNLFRQAAGFGRGVGMGGERITAETTKVQEVLRAE